MKVKEILLRMIEAKQEGFSCYECGEPIHVGESMIDCSDCGAVFCRACTINGGFANHTCDLDEYDFGDEE